MYRIVGCILVVAAGAGMGFSGSMRLSEQIRILEKSASDGDLPERRDPLRECITAGCFLWSSRKNEWKIQRVSHQCRGQDESGNRRKTFTDMQGMCGSALKKKLPLPMGKRTLFFLSENIWAIWIWKCRCDSFPCMKIIWKQRY